MVNYKGNPNLHGNKNSGRKSARVEFARNNVIKKSWNILDTRLEDIDDIQVALPIALKDMISRTDITSGGKPLPILGGATIQKDEDKGTDTEIQQGI